MRTIKIAISWLLVGICCGLVSSIEVDVFACAPRGVLKFIEAKFLAILFSLEFGLIGLIVGIIIFVVFRGCSKKMQSTYFHIALASFLSVTYLLGSLIAILRIPARTCALP